jgi:signal transduction histidine kinase
MRQRGRIALGRHRRTRAATGEAGGAALGPALPASVPTAVLAERERTLCWLHDGPLQALEYIAAAGWRGSGDADVAELAHVAAAAAEDLRRFIGEQGESAVHESFFTSVREVVEEARREGVYRTELVRGPTDGSLDAVSLLALIGALRETLTNVRKHSGATRVLVYCEEEDGRAVITVRDDGVGASPRELHGGFGVDRSIIGRMQSVGGWARLEPAPEGGLLVRLGADRPGAAS